MWSLSLYFFFFFNDTATTEIYTLSLHDALPILPYGHAWLPYGLSQARRNPRILWWTMKDRSEEHTSELQSQSNLVCRLLLEKKKKKEKNKKSTKEVITHKKMLNMIEVNLVH